MKRKILIPALLLLLPLLLVIGYFGGTWLISAKTESGVRAYVDRSTKPGPSFLPRFSLRSYDRGMFQSQALTTASLSAALPGRKAVAGEATEENGESSTEWFLRHRIYHGPLAFTPHGPKTGAAYVITTLDRDRLTTTAREVVDKIYGDREPFVITSQVPFAGARKIKADFAAVSHSDAGLEASFDGASGEWSISDGKAVSGSFRSTPLTLRGNQGDDRFSVEAAGSHLELDYREGHHSKADGRFGKWQVEAQGPNGQPVRIHLDETTIQTDFTALSRGSALAVGKGSFQLPLVEVTYGDESGHPQTGGLRQLSVECHSTLEGNLHGTKVDFHIESLDGWDATASPLAPLLPQLEEGGIRASFDFQLPREVAAAWVELLDTIQSKQQTTDREEPLPIDRNQLADTLELTCRQLGNGAKIHGQIAAGKDPGGFSHELRLAYRGDGPLTNKQNWKELFDTMDVESRTTLPYSLLQAFPQLEAQLAPALASGALVQDAHGISGSASFVEGKLSLNGRSNPLTQMLLIPLLSQPIDWEGLFQKLREGE